MAGSTAVTVTFSYGQRFGISLALFFVSLRTVIIAVTLCD